MDSAISRRSFLIASFIAGSAVCARPAYALQGSDGPLVAVGFSNLHEVTDEEIAAIVDQLPRIVNGPGALSTQAVTSVQAVTSGANSATYAGSDRYKTAAAIAEAAFPGGASRALIVSGEVGWPDALTAACLSAAIEAPILFCTRTGVPDATIAALKRLGVKKVFVIGGLPSVGADAAAALAKAGFPVEERLSGTDRQGTQLDIFQYGMKHSYWGKDLVILAKGSDFPDALSASPLAFAKKAPVFITGGDGMLSEAQKAAWRAAAQQGFGRRVAVLGSEASIPAATKSFADSMRALANGSGASERLGGVDRYATSVKIAEWAVQEMGFSWDNVAFTTGKKPWDALAGSALQGKGKSVLLLVDGPEQDTVKAAARHNSRIDHVRFFGDSQSIASATRNEILTVLSSRLASEAAGISLDRMLDLEVAASKGYHDYSRADLDASLNPDHFDYGTPEYYQFALVNGGYSGKVSAAQLDSFIATNGADGMLAGHGQDFIDAAKQYGTNEVYLLAHAILESGWGTSALAKGTEIEGKTYYNFFGIGAYDSDPQGGGSSTAGQYGWDSPRNAILGAASWIKDNYLGNSYGQNTLYKMKWNYMQAAAGGAVWKQYATSRTWATGIAKVMDSCYGYCGLDMTSSGLSFRIPQYS